MTEKKAERPVLTLYAPVQFPGRERRMAATQPNIEGNKDMLNKAIKFQTLADAQKYYMQQGLTIDEAMKKIRAEHFELFEKWQKDFFARAIFKV